MMQDWFTSAKLGIFIHWGIYAIQKRGGESWPIARGEVSYNDYLTQLEDFSASAYNPRDWAELIKKAGARYAVLTTKHHDGVALWPTSQDGPSTARDGNTGDLVKPFVEAMRDAGIHPGLYFSHTDWSNLDHWEIVNGLDREKLLALRNEPYFYRQHWGQTEPDYRDSAEHQAKWSRFLDFEKEQLREILTSYGTIDLLWFDVMLARSGFDYKCKELKQWLTELSPHTIINSRLQEHGDYETPEQFIPVHPPQGPWEFCVTTNNTWSYTGREEDYKTPFQLVSMFCECLGMGGNMLLNIGPDERGVIPAQQVSLLEELGSWISRHEEAVYETERGLPHGYAYGFSSLNRNRDTIYLYLTHLPENQTFIKGIHNEVKRVTLLGSDSSCSFKRVGGAPWQNVPGLLTIDLPTKGRDELATVVKVELDGPLNLYGGEGVEIDVN